MASRDLVQDRWSLVTLALLSLITLIAWTTVIMQASSMAMTNSADDRMADEIGSLVTPAALVAFVAAWSVMMAAMMLPSATPMILLYRNASRGQGQAGRALVRTWIFVFGYLVVWAAIGIPVYIASQSVRMAISANDQLAPWVPYAIAVVLALAGAYQFTPLKRVCLRTCQSPLAFLMGRWKPGRWGAVRMGAEHAMYCAGCCWGLMVVLVAAGAMGLAWVLLIALVIAAEKLISQSRWPVLITGSALLGLAILIAIQPGVALVLRGGMM
jgi:predicted metal-binding membrane protein